MGEQEAHDDLRWRGPNASYCGHVEGLSALQMSLQPFIDWLF